MNSLSSNLLGSARSPSSSQVGNHEQCYNPYTRVVQNHNLRVDHVVVAPHDTVRMNDQVAASSLGTKKAGTSPQLEFGPIGIDHNRSLNLLNIVSNILDTLQGSSRNPTVQQASRHAANLFVW